MLSSNYVRKVWLLGGETGADDGVDGTAVYSASIAGGANLDSSRADIGFGSEGFTLYFDSSASKTITVTPYAFVTGDFATAGNWVALPAFTAVVATGGVWYQISFTPPCCRFMKFNFANNAGGATTIRAMLMTGGR